MFNDEIRAIKLEVNILLRIMTELEENKTDFKTKFAIAEVRRCLDKAIEELQRSMDF